MNNIQEATELNSAKAGQIRVKVIGVGGAGGNALLRMVKGGLRDAEVIALNTDVQALRKLNGIYSFAIGPNATKGLGSGGHPDVGKRAIRESSEQVATLLQGADMVFVAAGMGGGTGTGASAVVADIARKQGALTVGVVTLPFSFEGPRRREVAEQGLYNLQQKVDTLIAIENDRLLPSLVGNVSLERALMAADEVLRQGVAWDFETFPEYLTALERRGAVLNIAAFIGHSSLRTWVMGAAAAERAATGTEIAEMRAIILDAMAAGAVGFATSTAGQHNGEGGVPMPSRLADAHEMMELTGALGEAGRGTFMLTKGMTTTVPWLEEIAANNGRPVMIAAMFVDPGDPERVFREIAEIEAARGRGRELWAQVGCFPLGMEFTLAHPYPLEALIAWHPAIEAEGGDRRATVLATGSEVSIAMAARDLLQADGIPAAVVSMPCWELFDVQDGEYRNQVLGTGVRVAVEAAVVQGWEKYIGDGGGFVGMTGFGASAPGGVLFEHFGITAEAVVSEVKKRLS